MMQLWRMVCTIVLWLMVSVGVGSRAMAQATDSVPPPVDSLFVTADYTEHADDSIAARNDSTLRALHRPLKAADSLQVGDVPAELPKARFVPDPKRALWLSLVLPGAGQIYNRKYWKLPIVYGAFMGCGYAISINQNRYSSYKNAYLDLYNDQQAGTVSEDIHKSYIAVLPEGYDLNRVGGVDTWMNTLKNRQNIYRRYRDYSILATKAVLDFIIIIVMNCFMGKGCAFSAIPVGLFQGSITLLAKFIKPIMTEGALANLSLIGSILIFCVGLNLVWGKKIRVANLLPAIIIAVVWAYIGC